MSEQKPNPNAPPHAPRRTETMQTILKAERLTQIAFVLPCAVLIGWGLGALLDKWLHQQWIYIAGVILGAIAGMVEAIRQAFKQI
ncbi:MAG TPA: AtpZ/AtpI family protein [Acidobacteriaceae bacterium]|nr:AtpZ/AtpI family protein [Acidobacteriaceae bacterium]